MFGTHPVMKPGSRRASPRASDRRHSGVDVADSAILHAPHDGDRVAYRSDIDRLHEEIARFATAHDERLTAVEHLINNLDTRVTTIDTRVTTIDARLDNLDTRVTTIETRLDNLDTRMSSVERQIIAIHGRIDVVDQKLVGVNDSFSHLERLFDARFTSLEKQIQLFIWVGSGIAGLLAAAMIAVLTRAS